VRCGHDTHAHTFKISQRSDDSKATVELDRLLDGRMDTTDCITLPTNIVSNKTNQNRLIKTTPLVTASEKDVTNLQNFEIPSPQDYSANL